MKFRRSSRQFLLATVLATGVLTACGTSPPPANELAIEVIDSMLTSGQITESVAQCMRDEVNTYEGEELDRIADLADKAEQGKSTDQSGIEAMAEFEASLSACRVG